MITTEQAIMLLRPDAEWTMSGGDVQNIIWHTEGVAPVTLDEIEAEKARAEAEKQAVIDARQSAISKLEALGLTVDEVQAAFGLGA